MNTRMGIYWLESLIAHVLYHSHKTIAATLLPQNVL